MNLDEDYIKKRDALLDRIAYAEQKLHNNNPVMPGFARFYFESKFAFGLSESRILKSPATT